MSKVPHLGKPAWSFAGLALLVVLLGAERAWRSVTERLQPPLAQWSVPDLARYLREQGIPVWVASSGERAPTDRRAYLTLSPKDWRDFNRMRKLSDHIAEWQGVVWCEKKSRDSRSCLMAPPVTECGLDAGEFLFFGDPALLARIRTALDVSDSVP